MHPSKILDLTSQMLKTQNHLNSFLPKKYQKFILGIFQQEVVVPDLNNTYYYYEFTIRGEKKYFGIRFLIDPSIISSLSLLLLYLFLLLL